ncbi:MAG: HDOD domain-containing protein [Pelosinus sp.]|nr:HDOD domain-containing protein [Pelosinus sp.]
MLGNTVHVARQPIFDTNFNVFGYELLFRNNFMESYDGTDGEQSTNSVIVNSFLLIGIETLTNGKKAFINFTAKSLKDNIPGMLPKELIAVEVLEDVIPDEEIINACKKLKQDGYMLVLDDFVFSEEFIPIIEMADIIKVDFRITLGQKRREIVQQLKKYPIKFLAEKVETIEEFEEAVKIGYSYFQGYFFCKPVITSHKNIPQYKVSYLHILQEVNQPELEFKEIEEIIKRDLSLSYQLLKFINSPAFGLKTKINSLHQALVLLGKKELIKWISLISLRHISKDKPGELVLESLLRARFGERLALTIMPKQRAANVFLIGMFSHIDILLERPLQHILVEMSLAEEIKNALLAKDNGQFSVLYKLILSYEKGDWEEYSKYAKELGIVERDVLNAYRESLVWAHDIIAAN